MIVYVESNFVLEVALEQEQAFAAEAILKLLETGKIEMAFPCFAISEPFTTVMNRDKERAALHRSLDRTLRQLQRSEPHKQIILDLQPALQVLKDAINRELDLLHMTVGRLLNAGKSIELDEACLKQAVVYQTRFGLKPQDSIIYSTVIADLQTRPSGETKCFLSRDKEAFLTDLEIKTELASYNCRYIGSFVDGLSFIERFS
jgi:hypothetical protein